MVELVLPALGTKPVLGDGRFAAEPSSTTPPAVGPALRLPGPPSDAPPWAKEEVPIVRTSVEARVINLNDNAFLQRLVELRTRTRSSDPRSTQRSPGAKFGQTK